MTMNALVQSVRPTGGLGIVGVFVEEDPGSKDELAQKGQIPYESATQLSSFGHRELDGTH